MNPVALIIVIAVVLILCVVCFMFFFRHKIRMEKRKRLDSPYAKKLSDLGISPENILVLIQFKLDYENNEWIENSEYDNSKNNLCIADWKYLFSDYQYKSRLLKNDDEALIELELLYKKFLQDSVTQLYTAFEEEEYELTPDTLARYWQLSFPSIKLFYVSPDNPQGLKILSDVCYDAIFSKLKDFAKTSFEVFECFNIFTHCKNYGGTFQSLVYEDWRKKLLNDPLYKDLLEKELKGFETAGVIDEKFIEYFKSDHPAESKTRIKLTFDRVAFEELEKKLDLRRMSGLQAIPLAELTQAYNRFVELIISQ